MKKSIFLMLCAGVLFAQTEPVKDLLEVKPRVFALQHAIVHVEPGKSLPDATIVLRDGMIEAAGSQIAIPPDATLLDMDGAHIYAGFIDSYVEIDAVPQKAGPRKHWIDLVHPEWVAADAYASDDKALTARHDLGFTSIHAVLDSGIFRGASSIIGLDRTPSIAGSSLCQVLDFYTRPWGSEGYPDALLGTIAVMRQTLYDAAWYGEAQGIYAKYPDKNEAPQMDLALETLYQARTQKKPFLVKTKHETAALRAVDIAHEFDLELWLMGSGYEYRRLDELAAESPFVILPLNFPAAPDVSDPFRAAQYTTEQLKHWDMAPDNAAKLAARKIDFAFSTQGLKNLQTFRKHLGLAVERGLDAEDALAALTTTPARYFGLSRTHGMIKAGYQADLVVVDGDYFGTDGPVKSLWIRGEEYVIKPESNRDYQGKWRFQCAGLAGGLQLSGDDDHLQGKLTLDTTKIPLKHLKINGRQISWSADLGKVLNASAGITRFKGSLDQGQLSGTALLADGKQVPWVSSERTQDEQDDPKKPQPPSTLSPCFPEGAFGFDQLPSQPKSLFIHDATLWTSSDQGVIEEGDILIENGKIARIGTNLSAPKGSQVIEARGKHVTPGLIDPHSHTAGESINEGSQSVTSEVRIQDVIDPDDISIYRELAGGLTTIHVLHGSANTVGGQNAVIKLRWGSNAHGLIMKQSPPSLKFALGENVKQSNWGDNNVTRYPQTRMGVEQVLRDAFSRARDYQHNLELYAKQTRWRKTTIQPRKDLELEPLVEVLQGKRRSHVHSYRQDEILMMTRVAEDFGFTVTNLEHCLEGFKVADRIAQHGAGAATFSDWWAYKFEVYDAIPYNAVIMQDAGVLVSFKSDSDELARRMNLEAAKGVKYGGMTEIQALNAVTINPAKQLKIDKWVGSLEVGKDADFVIWSKHPLSTQAVCEATWIEGREYFNIDQNARLVERDKHIREMIIQKILAQGDDKRADGLHLNPEPPPTPDRDDLSWERREP